MYQAPRKKLKAIPHPTSHTAITCNAQQPASPGGGKKTNLESLRCIEFTLKESALHPCQSFPVFSLCYMDFSDPYNANLASAKSFDLLDSEV